MGDDEADSETLDALREKNRRLHEQIKQLVRTEKRLYQTQNDLDRRVRVQEELNTFALEAARAHEPDQLFEALIDLVDRLYDVDQVHGVLVDPDQGQLDLVAARGETTSDPEARGSEPDRALADLLQGLETIHIRDPRAEEPQETFEALEDWSISNTPREAMEDLPPFEDSLAVIVPLTPAKTDRGGALILRRFEAHARGIQDVAPDRDELDTLELIRHHTEAALETVLLYKEVRRAADRLEDKVDERTAELKDAKDQAEQQSSLLRATLESTADGILVTDFDGDIVTFNQQFQEMWRIPDEVLEDRDDQRTLEYVEKQLVDPAAFVDRIEEIYRSDEESFDILEFKDGRIFERYSKPQTLGGETVGRVWSFHDVTDERQALRRLEQANEDLRQFAYVAGHDLQEPVRVVASYVQMLEKRYADDLDETAREYIRYAVEGSRRISDLIQGLLKYSRVDTQASEPEPVDLKNVLADVCQGLSMRIDETEATIESGDLPTVEGDPRQVSQVLQNLIGNALKFHRESVDPHIEVRAEPVGDQWRITVSDNGVGIDPEDADELFTLFERGSGQEAIEGQGIGLSICKKIVERHGGEIGVESGPDAGSTFWFTLPAAQGSTPQ